MSGRKKHRNSALRILVDRVLDMGVGSTKEGERHYMV
jgi:hypothetical protein